MGGFAFCGMEKGRVTIELTSEWFPSRLIFLPLR